MVRKGVDLDDRSLRFGGCEDVGDSFLGNAGLGYGQFQPPLEVTRGRLGAVERPRLKRHLDALRKGFAFTNVIFNFY